MIISGWTMRRFHISSLLLLMVARLAPGMPMASPARLARSPAAGDGGGGDVEQPTTAAEEVRDSEEPEVERITAEERGERGRRESEREGGRAFCKPRAQPTARSFASQGLMRCGIQYPATIE